MDVSGGVTSRILYSGLHKIICSKHVLTYMMGVSGVWGGVGWGGERDFVISKNWSENLICRIDGSTQIRKYVWFSTIVGVYFTFFSKTFIFQTAVKICQLFIYF
jgi:hypothetical protein